MGHRADGEQHECRPRAGVADGHTQQKEPHSSGQWPLVALIPDALSTCLHRLLLQVRGHQEGQLTNVAGPRDAPCRRTASGLGNACQGGLLHAGDHHFALPVGLEASPRLRNRRPVRGPHRQGVDADVGRRQVRHDRVEAGVPGLSVGQHQDGAVDLLVEVEEIEAGLQGRGQRAALRLQGRGAQVVDDVAQGGVIEGERHAGVGAACEDHQAHPLTGQHLEEVVHLAPGSLQAAGVDILRVHRAGDVDGHHQLDAFVAELSPRVAPARLGHGDHGQREPDQAQSGAPRADTLEPRGDHRGEDARRKQRAQVSAPSTRRPPQPERCEGHRPEEVQPGAAAEGHGSLRNTVCASSSWRPNRASPGTRAKRNSSSR